MQKLVYFQNVKLITLYFQGYFFKKNLKIIWFEQNLVPKPCPKDLLRWANDTKASIYYVVLLPAIYS
jgi:hypothetical protein